MAFTRRYPYNPGADILSQIEGTVILDLAPPGTTQGVSQGTAGVIGECQDMTYATAVTAAGVVSSSCQPVQIFSAQDLLDKIGSFDATLGEFGDDGGNMFCELRSKTFGALVVVPINLCSATGLRVWRHLPTNVDATHAVPVVPITGARVDAGREFKDGANRMRLGRPVFFVAADPRCSAVDGVQVAAGPAATMTFTSATGAFVANNCAKGDILVQGVIGGSGSPGTYRIVAVGSASSLTVEAMDGTNLTWAGVTALPFRVYPAAVADCGGATSITEQAGCQIPTRPLDASITTATSFLPTVVPTAETASSWDALSGLGAHAVAAITYTAAVQGVNAATASGLETEYAAAFASLLGDEEPAALVNILWSARGSNVIRAAGLAHALASSANGHSRVFIATPEVDTLTLAAAASDSDPGVGAHRDERVICSWPGVKTFIPEASGVTVKGADASNVIDGTLDLPFASWYASLLSQLPSERNPGENTALERAVFATILGLQRGAPKLGIAEYTYLQQKGISAVRIDRSAGGAVIQSGITSSLISGQKNVNRRRMADEIEDSAAAICGNFSKLPQSEANKDALVSELTAYMDGLLSPNNKAAQRIADYSIGSKSGNTPALTARGFFVVIINVQTLATMDFIVLTCSISEAAISVTAA